MRSSNFSITMNIFAAEGEIAEKLMPTDVEGHELCNDLSVSAHQ